jgi:hypothetical protein
MQLGLFKFKYGEEIIAEYTESGNSYFVQNTAGLVPAEDFHWHLMTWMPYTTIKNGFNIPKSEIWFVTELSEDMKEYYYNWKAAIQSGMKEVPEPKEKPGF